MSQSLTAARLPEFLLSQGRHTFTAEEAAGLLGRPLPATRRAIARLRGNGKVFLAGRGLYVVIAPEYHSWNTVPAAHFIDDLMRVRGRSYYVALLSAAEIHGAAHQAPQVFQVIVDRTVRDRDLGRVRLRFHVGKHVAEYPDEGVGVRNTPTGTMRISGPELTAVDLVDYVGAAAGMDHVATVLCELPDLNGDALALIASRRERAVARRLGWLLERLGSDDLDLEPLRRVAAPEEGVVLPLRPGMPSRGPADRSWGLRINTQVEPDEL